MIRGVVVTEMYLRVGCRFEMHMSGYCLEGLKR